MSNHNTRKRPQPDSGFMPVAGPSNPYGSDVTSPEAEYAELLRQLREEEAKKRQLEAQEAQIDAHIQRLIAAGRREQEKTVTPKKGHDVKIIKELRDVSSELERYLTDA
ncbi:hypothetical protein K435DRAFT_873351 [Dendrothele bispora CBS 962.96]|uniref:Uncharacterized protein n=1 Tax=Dendrothele bispora (strain CBS 962.96) TaxID=1314807 RepID=A0A4S8KZC3_DENBC|nr:hypothetical protein K435DRAFT_810231 [Dendrothele bispora CBS 962.96]THU81422.1 hypothetical protein K435DRAFT_873351 [Dendrothele bispora CBS 962.96]